MRLKWRRWAVGLLAAIVFFGGLGAYLIYSDVCVYPGPNKNYCDAQALVAAATLYRTEHGACPVVEDLLREHAIDRTRPTTDVWRNPFEIICRSDDIWIESAGPDEVRNTDDDFDSRQGPASRGGWKYR